MLLTLKKASPDGNFMMIFRLLACLFMVSCVSVEKEDRKDASPEGLDISLEDQRRLAVENFDLEACDAQGGSMSIEGILGMPRCTISYPDAGNRCQDARECGGQCFANDTVTDFSAVSGEAFGICAATDSPFGCYSILVNGTPEPMICVD